MFTKKLDACRNSHPVNGDDTNRLPSYNAQESCMARARHVPHAYRLSLTLLLLRGTIVNRTYGAHKNLYI